jgi:hypothetical protein
MSQAMMTSASLDATALATEEAARSTPGIAAWVREWFAGSRLDHRTRYLADANDHADMERRMAAWDAHERCGITYFF